jgi:hypothetical protein
VDPTPREPHQVTVEKRRYMLAQTISREIIARGQIGQVEDFLTGNYVRRMALDIWVDPLEGRTYTEHVTVCASWYQAFRSRFYPRRWLRRYPVRTRDIPVEIKCTWGHAYPEARLEGVLGQAYVWMERK